jgi:hypothetical protein
VNESIYLDIVDLDDGYHAYYVNGFLDRDDSSEHLGDAIATYVTGKYVAHCERRCLGGVGMDAVNERGEAMPKRFKDIPPRWWLERWEAES